MGAPRGNHDWEAVERDFRTTRLTYRELGAKHGIYYTSIAKRATKEGWQRDLSAEVRQATKANLVREAVKQRQQQQRAEHDAATDEAVKQRIAEEARATVDAVVVAAQANTKVVLRHRSDIAEAREVSLALLNEVRTATIDPDGVRALFDKVTEDMDQVTKTIVAQRFGDMMKIHSRVGSMHKLADTLAKLQTLERKAFGLDEEGDDEPNSYEDSLRKLAGAA